MEFRGKELGTMRMRGHCMKLSLHAKRYSPKRDGEQDLTKWTGEEEEGGNVTGN